MPFVLLILLVILSLILIFTTIFLAIALVFHFYYENFKRNPPFVPTSTKKYRKELNELFEFLKKLNLKNKRMVDLGSGNGRIVKEFAKMGYEKCVGIEINPWLVFLSRLSSRKFKNVQFIRGNFLNKDLSDFGIVYVYQLLAMNKKLLPKFENELRNGSIIVSHKFPLPYQSDKIRLIKIIGKNNFLVYQKIEEN